MDILLVGSLAAIISVLQYCLGSWVVSVIDHKFANHTGRGWSVRWLTGILIHLSASYWILCLGINWWIGVFLPLLPGLMVVRDGQWRELLRIRWRLPGINWSLWTVVTTLVGFTLLTHHEAYTSYWQTTEGDYAFHLSVISSFVFGDNFPAHYPIFAGATFSYPFLADLWSAMYWRAAPTPGALGVVFAIQWFISAQMLFALLDGRRLFPWIILLGGGSYLLFFFREYSWMMVHHLRDVPWSTMLASVWVPERSALPGALVALAVVKLLFEPSRGRAEVIIAGILLGLSPLVSTQFFVVTSLSAGLALLIDLARLRYRSANYSVELTRGEEDLVMLTLITGGLFLLPLPILLGKSSVLTVIYGWNVPRVNGATPLGSIMHSLGMWWDNCWQWFLAVGFVVWRFKYRSWWLALGIVFLLANVLQFAVWDWDQIKFFVAIYVIFVGCWSMLATRGSWVEIALIIVMTIPAVAESARLLVTSRTHYVIYNEKAIEAAGEIRKLVPPKAVITGAPTVNSPILLSGRPTFASNYLWLMSHGLDYAWRYEIFRNYDLMATCYEGQMGIDPEFCPRYLLWSDQSTKYLKQKPPADYQVVGKFDGSVLYKIPNRKSRVPVKIDVIGK